MARDFLVVAAVITAWLMGTTMPSAHDKAVEKAIDECQQCQIGYKPCKVIITAQKK
jgi:hypothetical protein